MITFVGYKKLYLNSQIESEESFFNYLYNNRK